MDDLTTFYYLWALGELTLIYMIVFGQHGIFRSSSMGLSAVELTDTKATDTATTSTAGRVGQHPQPTVCAI